MKVLLCMFDVYAGGAETQFRYLAEYLANNPKIELTCLFEKLDSSPNSKAIKFLQENRIKYFNLNIDPLNTTKGRIVLRLHLGKLRRWIIGKKICNFLKNSKYDWVITYNYTFLPHVEIFHKNGCKMLFSERNDASAIKNSKENQNCIRLCDVVTCNSLNASDEIKKICKVVPHYIHNGISVSNVNFKPAVKTQDAVQNILVSARVSPEKNLDVLIEALIEATELPIKIHICGKIVDNNYYQLLTERIKQNKLENKIEFHGFQSNMEKWYHDSLFVILPSFQEGTPNAILEAYAYGTPAIASNIRANAALFKDSHLLFKADDKRDLIKSINYIMNLRKNEWDSLINSNYDMVCQEYNVEKMCLAYFNLMNS